MNIMKHLFSCRLGRIALIAATALLFMAPTNTMAQTQSGYLMTQSEKDAIKDVIREFIRENPSYIIEVLQESASKEAANRAERQDKIENPPEGLYNSSLTPSVGNPDAQVTVVEFFDYNCGYCKRMINDVNRLIESNPNIKFVFKDLPILSDASQIAARYALAAGKQDKYLEMHTALMKHFGQLDEKEILRIASGAGLDLNKLQEDLYDTDVGDALSENMQLAQELGVRGTPFFVINNKILPGAVGYERLASEIEQAAQAASAGE